ncbi:MULTISPECIES: DUF4331 family protein [unclassified Streptomyces]|uniref:DUF4331 family protein n=1 Tax=unclassified Streptomyces TaxID=2593676 RepID=UPI002E17C6F4|nr:MULTISPECIES: DUF4331 family protein [unclassified Streptomyces]
MNDARLDLTDLFAFTVPGGRTALIMNVNPIAPTGGQAFHPDAVYRINVDTDGDQQADIAFSFFFSEPRDGQQTAAVYRVTGGEARAHEAAGQMIVSEAPVSFGPAPNVIQAGPYLYSAGLRSDPSFADLDGIIHDSQWTGVDWDADKNIFGIVLEMPDTELGSNPVFGVWARVSLRQNGALKSVGRGAHPSLTTYFNPENDAKTAYNEGGPAQDWETSRALWTAALQHAGDHEPQDAEQALRTVPPDTLRFDRDQPAAYPNGRTLTDDVTSARLAMVSGGKITGDHIGPHTDLLPEFPYLGTPHPAPAG